METIQPSEMIKGGVYTYQNDEEYQIFRFVELKNLKVWAKESIDCIDGFYSSSKGFYGNTATFKKATQDEVKWLEACEKENKFINKEKALEMENFKFKVGDKIQFKNWSDCTCIEILSLKGEGENNFTGIAANNKVDGTYIKNDSWELYKEPKQKTKLQKFYYVTNDGNYNYAFFKPENKKDYLLTEEEFLEKFEIIK